MAVRQVSPEREVCIVSGLPGVPKQREVTGLYHVDFSGVGRWRFTTRDLKVFFQSRKSSPPVYIVEVQRSRNEYSMRDGEFDRYTDAKTSVWAAANGARGDEAKWIRRVVSATDRNRCYFELFWSSEENGFVVKEDRRDGDPA